ncbi:2-dehydropantoate 2-reductase [Gloeobacter kilaueensis JS1]|uniref:2-dehydropantoate 2-reductase n=2 Tax=Gloeobacter TaxID=33071 RepID=U5QGB7_GLOK1|nr:2-dehydropantoate 2-reductase [Gloeobacter kilaueensis JS1]
MSRRYAVLGTGAVGGFYGARLQRAGAEVHFLARSDYEQIARAGLRVQSPEGDFHLSDVRVYRQATAMPPCDVVLVALKTTQNALLAELLPPALKPGGTVVLLQNGMGSEQQVAAIVDKETPILGGLTFICANKIGPGLVQHIDYGIVTLGAYAHDEAALGVTAPMAAVAADLQTAGIPVQLAEDLQLARWSKLIWNIPFNGLSVLLEAKTDELMSDPATAELAKELMEEVVAGALACGRRIPEDFIDKMLDHTRRMQPYRTSMKLDYEQGRELELEAIYATPLRTARAAGFEMVRVGVLYRQLQFLDGRQRA